MQPLPYVQGVTSPFSPEGAHQIAAKGNIAYAQIHFTTDTADIPTGAVKNVISAAQGAATSGVQVELGGSPISAAATAAPGPSEGIGITAALIIMLLAFGSIVAMGLPVITVLAGLGIGIALLELITHLLVVPNFSPEMAAMIGIGVGIDYALFIVTRYRQGIFEGRTPRDAVMMAHMTAGRSVLFAGTTVVISLFGLFLIGQPYMIGLATGCIAAVLMVLSPPSPSCRPCSGLRAAPSTSCTCRDSSRAVDPHPRAASGIAGAGSCSGVPGSPAPRPC